MRRAMHSGRICKHIVSGKNCDSTAKIFGHMQVWIMPYSGANALSLQIV